MTEEIKLLYAVGDQTFENRTHAEFYLTRCRLEAERAELIKFISDRLNARGVLYAGAAQLADMLIDAYEIKPKKRTT